MDNSAERRVEELFRKAVDLEPEQRTTFLDEACAGDPPEIRRRAQALLDQHRPPGLLGAMWTDDDAARTEAPSSQAGADQGTWIGPYRLIRRLGEGGMGEVWLAEQLQPVRRRVALKMIRWGANSSQVVARFEAERQALALLEHPNVAKIFDAGVTGQDRPYFAMEYVPGVPFTQYCDDHRLPNRERLRLFSQVCDGVQHAHQRGVIHRDLKPSNILVTVLGEKPAAKIIDFGLAKATAQKLTEMTLYTEAGVLVGTPEYMSPEQAGGTPEDVDTRTDVYSLGVILYELLVGALPYDPAELRRAGFEGVRRKIREDEPPKPSERLSALGERSRVSAEHRRSALSTLVTQIRGDLDWIVMRALEKERNRRYTSPADLWADIERHLRDEPVLAGPPSATYRARKFFRRHRIGVTVASAALAGLLVFAGSMATLASRIASERDRANQEADTANRVTKFLTELFENADARESDLGRMTAGELLEQGVEELRRQDGLPAPVRARLLSTLGSVLSGLGHHDDAEPLLEEAVTLSEAALGPDAPTTIEALKRSAAVHQSKNHLQQAESLLVEVLSREQARFGRDSEQALDTERLIGILCHYDPARLEESESRLRAAGERSAISLGAEHPLTLRLQRELAGTLQRQDRWEDAEPILATTLAAAKRTLGADHRDSLTLLDELASTRWHTGGPEEAEPLWQELIDRRAATLGATHPRTLAARNNMALLWLNNGRPEDAERTYREICEAQMETLGRAHRSTQICLLNTGVSLVKQERWSEAGSFFQQVYEIRRDELGPEHRLTLRSLGGVASMIWHDDRAEGLALGYQVLEIRRRQLGDDPDTVSSLSQLAEAHEADGDFDRAIARTREQLEMQQRMTTSDSPAAQNTMNRLAGLLLAQDPVEAEKGREALRLALDLAEMSDHRVPEFLATLSRALYATGQRERAIESQRQAIALVPADAGAFRERLEAVLRAYESNGPLPD